MGALNPEPMISPTLTTKAPTGTSPAIWATRACSSAARMNASSSATVVVVHAVCSVTAPLWGRTFAPTGLCLILRTVSLVHGALFSHLIGDPTEVIGNILLAQLPVETAGGHAEDRPLVRDRHDCRAGGNGAGVHHHQPSILCAQKAGRRCHSKAGKIFCEEVLRRPC